MDLSNNQLYFFRGSSYTYILNKCNASSAIVDNDILNNTINNHNDDSLLKLKRRGILDFEKRIPPNIHEIRPVSFMIDFTKSCQNRCVYCFRDLKQNAFIQQSDLQQILDYIIHYCNSNSIKNIALQPWGGEPLLAWDKIKFTQDYLIKHNIIPQINIETNAISINSSLAKELYDRKIAISVSIDGPEEIHNQNRPLYGKGGGSFDKTIKGFRALQKVGYENHIGIVCVVTKNSVKHLDEIIDFFVNDLQIHRAKMNIIRDNSNIIDKSISLNNEDVLCFCEKLCDKLEKVASNGYSFCELGVIERLHNLFDLKPTSLCCSRGCQGHSRIFSFDMIGNIYPCDLVDNPELTIGNITENLTFSQMIERCNNKFYSYKYNEKYCSDCEYHFFCKGGCPAMNIFNNTDVDIVECLRNKYLYKRLINIALEQPGLISSLTNHEINII